MARLGSTASLWGIWIGWNLFTIQVAAQELSPSVRPIKPSESAVSAWLENNRHRPPRLRAFVQRMPKGGDIHTHLSGAVYAEHYLRWAASEGYCVDPAGPSLVPPKNCGTGSTFFAASELTKKPAIYDKLVNLWSTRNLAYANRSGHDRFFEAFTEFDLLSSSRSLQDEMVAEVANRAASQHTFYLELLLTLRGSEVRQLGRTVGWSGNFAQMRQQLLNAGLTNLVAKGAQDLATLNTEVANRLRCGTAQAQPGCEVTVRFMQQTTRTRPPEEVFAQFVYAFELARSNSGIVGVNLVAPEDHPIALRDYTLQMQMVQYLKTLFPEVKVSLHAGELTLGLVPPEELRFHIRQAVQLAQADRIGHGVGIMYEEQPFQLLEEMRRRGVLVEICLTSNAVILNVKGEEHPFLDYRAVGVPLTLASDDEGISRIDLSNEYLLAAKQYDLSYPELKDLARNSLEYSFLKGESLWESPRYARIKPPCAEDIPGSAALSSRCASFLNGSDRAKAQWKLESEFATFEAIPSFRSSARATPASKRQQLPRSPLSPQLRPAG